MPDFMLLEQKTSELGGGKICPPRSGVYLKARVKQG